MYTCIYIYIYRERERERCAYNSTLDHIGPQWTQCRTSVTVLFGVPIDTTNCSTRCLPANLFKGLAFSKKNTSRRRVGTS